MDSEDEELALLCVLLDEDKLDKKKRKFWVRHIYRKRNEFGAFETLVRKVSLGDREYYFK